MRSSCSCCCLRCSCSQNPSPPTTPAAASTESRADADRRPSSPPIFTTCASFRTTPASPTTAAVGCFVFVVSVVDWLSNARLSSSHARSQSTSKSYASMTPRKVSSNEHSRSSTSDMTMLTTYSNASSSSMSREHAANARRTHARTESAAVGRTRRATRVTSDSNSRSSVVDSDAVQFVAAAAGASTVAVVSRADADVDADVDGSAADGTSIVSEFSPASRAEPP
mmetsp:Transcript_5752/g.20838  ORF Transcript_5752/g.20838 Transcript_5752/m.20838 type:complete len:225 (-) Transcript_5752:266-940(-)